MEGLPKTFYERLGLKEQSQAGEVLRVAVLTRLDTDRDAIRAPGEKSQFLCLEKENHREIISLWTDEAGMVTIIYGLAADLLETEVTIWRVTIDINGLMKTRVYVMENPLDETRFVKNILTAIMGNHEVSQEAWTSMPSSSHGEKEGQFLV